MSDRNDLAKRRSNLTPEQRALLEKRLRGSGKKTADSSTWSEIPHRPADLPVPLSFAQQRLWFLDLLESGNVAYNIPNALRMRGRLLVDALRQSLAEVVRRHETLRTTIVKVDGEPVQIIAPELTIPLEEIEADAPAGDVQEAWLRELVLAEAAKPFSLSEGPLLRAALVRLSPEDHVLLLSMHHIISDGWSMGVLIEELTAAYIALAQGMRPALPEAPIQYGDYAVWQREWLQGDMLKNQLHYWKEKLGSTLPILQLPTDRPRPEVLKIKGAVHTCFLSKSLTDELNKLSQSRGATLFMTLLAAFNTLLYRYTGQEELLIGTPFANRQQESVQKLIGFFVNTLVLRSELQPEMTFAQLLDQVRETTLGALQNPDVPFEKLVEELQPERNRSYSPLFQVMFASQNVLANKLELPGLSLELLDLGKEVTTQFDLTLDIEEEPTGLTARFKYNALLFEEATIERMAGHYAALLNAITADPDMMLSDLRVLLESSGARGSDSELLTRMNDTAADYDLDQLLLDAFMERAEREPERVALRCDGETMTYGELHRCSNQVAHFLRGQGVRPNQLVGILMERGLEMFVGLYGIVKSGAAYVPIDPEYPAQRVRYMIEDSDAPVVLTKRAYLDQLASVAADLPGLRAVLALDPAGEQTPVIGEAAIYSLDGAHLPDETPARVNEPGDIAYMIYTSGSTGNPKGVKVPHRAIINRLLWHQEQFQAGADDVIAQRTSVCFDVSVWELFWALRHGAQIAIIPSAVVKDPYRMHQLLKQEQVSVMHFVPSLFSLFVSSLQNIDAAQRVLSSLRAVVTSGEALHDKPVQLWFEMFPNGAQIVNLYGPTEAAVDVTCYVIDRKPERSILIGQPIANTQLYVLDPQGRQCPVLVKGELYIGGVQLAEGYHNKPDKTAEAFVQNHLPGTPGERLYRTGDLARVLPDGNIEYLGRIDSQVKVRGFRIEMGEIENALIQHTAVENAAVIVRKGADGNNMLVAFYAVKQGVLEPGALKSFLGAKMPEYMIPSFFHAVDKIPLSPNGKADRRALADLKVEDASRDAKRYTPPVNELQAKIAAIWGAVLQRDQIGIEDNFFDLGGHSLLVVKVHDALKQELGIDIPMTDLFQYTTVKALAEAIAGPSVAAAAPLTRTHPAGEWHDTDVAIIGIGLRFPQANTPDEFWDNLRAGKECITHFPAEEMEQTFYNQDPANRQKLVFASGLLDRVDHFDAELFQMNEREATLLDPQQRLFLTCVWEAIEDAGYNVDSLDAPVSLYAGAGYNQYLPVGAFGTSMADIYQAMLASQPSYMATRVSYKLNLTGESMMLHTACSTSLVAVHMACKSLINGESDFALAGGASIQVPQKSGYIYEPNFIMSPDGHCRAFDKDASGTVAGNGVGVVLLKRLVDAKRDGDPIYAVIKGTAINNDGNQKIGYTAPSVQGQMSVIAAAQAVADVDPDTITMIEAHGTGTKLGDPIEVSALTQVFRQSTKRSRYCAIGSVKTNIGHLDTAAGIAGLIKTALALHHGEIPPSLHFTEPNPQINFSASPFFVNTELKPWTTDGAPRRAGVSSFGIGGTNAHAVLEEAPAEI